MTVCYRTKSGSVYEVDYGRSRFRRRHPAGAPQWVDYIYASRPQEGTRLSVIYRQGDGDPAQCVTSPVQEVLGGH